VIPRIGIEWRLEPAASLELPVRVGYRYEATPLADDSSANFVDADRHVPSLGLGLDAPSPAPLSGRLRLDLHAAWSEFVPRSVEAPDGTSRRASGSVLVLGATFGVDL
jgi:hypothetical protein